MKWYVRLVVAAGSALAFGVVVALAITVVDLYLTGHAKPSLSQPVVSIPGVSPKLSVSDVLLLAGTVLPGVTTWLLLRNNRARDE